MAKLKSKVRKPKSSKVKSVRATSKQLFGKKTTTRKKARLTKIGESFKKEIKLSPAVKPAKMVSRTLILKDVYEVTPKRYKDRSKYAVVRNFRARADYSGDIKEAVNSGRRVVLAECYTTHDSQGNPKDNAVVHYQFIIGYSTNLNDRLWTNKCKVSCSCEDFLYTDEVALHKRGNSDIYFSNGADPVVKNPKMRPQTCKHLLAVMREIRAKRL